MAEDSYNDAAYTYTDPSYDGTQYYPSTDTVNDPSQYITSTGSYAGYTTGDVSDPSSPNYDPTYADPSKTGGLDLTSVASGIGKSAMDALKSRYTTNGQTNWANVLKDGTAAFLAYQAYQQANASNNRPPTGYQGGIPSLVASRAAVPTSTAARPGAGGQRYLTDTRFAKASDSSGLAAAAAAQQAQQTALAQQNAANGQAAAAATKARSDAAAAANAQAKQQAQAQIQVPTAPVTHPIQGFAVAPPPNQQETTTPIQQNTAAQDQSTWDANDQYNGTPGPVYMNGMAPVHLPNGGRAAIRAARYAQNNTDEDYAAGGEVSLPERGFVLSADVVSHAGNGNSEAGAAKLRQLLGDVQYLDGPTDGMADEVPANIGGAQRAAVAHGEMIVSPEAVARIGGGDIDKGTDALYKMMDALRKQRTGTKRQGKQVDVDKVVGAATGGGLQALAKGGKIMRFAAAGDVPSTSAISAGLTGTESNLSNWAGDYVTNMLAQGRALSEMPYQAYQGPLSAGDSALQSQAYQNASNLAVPSNITNAANTAGAVGQQMGQLGYNPQQVYGQNVQGATTQAAQANNVPSVNTYQMGPAQQVGTQDFRTAGTANSFMSPYMQSVVDAQQREAQRTADVATTNRHSDQTKQGAFGGSRGAIMDAEAARNLATQQGDIQAKGLQDAYTQAQSQFNTQQQAGLTAQQANQQAGLTVGTQNLGSQNTAQALGVGTQTQYGLANLNNQQAANTANAGYTQQANLANQGNSLAVQNANVANQQFGANYGLQALQQQLSAAQTQGALGSAENQAGLANLNAQMTAGNQQQTTEQAGITADQAAFNAERANPFNMVTYQQSLLTGLPLQAQSYNTTTNPYAAAANAATGSSGLLNGLFGNTNTSVTPTTTP